MSTSMLGGTGSLKETVAKSVFLSRLKVPFWDWGATSTSPGEQFSLAALENLGVGKEATWEGN